MITIFDQTVTTITGEQQNLDALGGHVLLIVNTASKCGFTPQLEGLEALFTKYKSQGLIVLGFPCNQFAQQDPEEDQQIANFCQKNYGVSFPMYSKVLVNGPQAHPVFTQLKTAAPGVMGEKIKWNFTKFLVSRDGLTVKRFAPMTKPEKLEKDIIKMLAQES